jgi:DNA-binding transcriptional regulator YiaG
MYEYQIKIEKNALIGERILKLTQSEKQKIVTKLLSNMSEQELSDQTGIPKSTLHDWKTRRQDNTGENLHVSLAIIKRKLQNFIPRDQDDIVRLYEIKNIINRLIGESE